MIRKRLAALCIAFLGLGMLSTGERTAQSATIITDGHGNADVNFVQTKAGGGSANPGQPGGSPGAGSGGTFNGLPPLLPLDLILEEVDLLLGLLLQEVRRFIDSEARQ